jgi:ribosomal protein S21
VPVIIRAKSSDSTSDVIRKFKKAVAATDLVQKVKDRAFFQKPSKIKAVKRHDLKRAQKRLRSLKKQKNVAGGSIARLTEMIQ